MRSSSVKTLVSVVSLTLTLVVVPPSAEARPSQPARASQTSTQIGVTARVQRVVRLLLQRALRIAADALPTDPHPRDVTDDMGASALPTDPHPVATP